MCAHILSCVGSHGSSEREVRHHCKTIHTHDDHVGCDDHLTEAVGQRLYDNHGHGKDGLGDTGGKSQPDDLQCVFLFHLQMAEFEIKDIGHPQQFPETEYSGYCLCDDGCIGDTGDTHL